MTRILGNYVRGEAILKINSMQALKTESDDALTARVRKGLRCADERDSNGTRLGFWELVAAPVEFYEGIAAMRLLGERHGEDYTLNLMGYRRPETAWKRIKYFFSGELPAKI